MLIWEMILNIFFLKKFIEIKRTIVAKLYNLFESFTVAIMTWSSITEYCVTNDHIYCRNHNPVLFSFMMCHRICHKSNMMDATSGTWIT
jgi:hypothetical protein